MLAISLPKQIFVSGPELQRGKKSKKFLSPAPELQRGKKSKKFLSPAPSFSEGKSIKIINENFNEQNMDRQ